MVFVISHFSILTANHTFISSRRVLPSCGVLHCMLHAKVYLQTQPISHRKHNDSITKSASLEPAHISQRTYITDHNSIAINSNLQETVTTDDE